MAETPLFEVHNITKVYPGVVANKDVSLSIDKGSIHALLGENGAGKSTLVKIIYGLVKPTSGEMYFNGETYAPAKPQEARAKGVGMVFQHFSLFDAMNVTENIALGLENAPSARALRKEVITLSQNYGLPIDPDAVVGKLSAGERQRVEIVRCLLQNPRLLIMDEPTSVLTPGEVEILFETLRRLRDDGVSVLYISHKLEEIRTICDHATILRHGQVVAEVEPKAKTAVDLAELMIGETLLAPRERSQEPADLRLEVKNAALKTDEHFGTNLKNINLHLRAHEILGIAGVAGNGQDELLELFSGELPLHKGQIFLDHHEISKETVRGRRRLGVITAPEERLGHAAVPGMDLAQNALLTGQDRMQLGHNKWLRWDRVQNFAQDVIRIFDVRTAGTHVLSRSLSGGNLQKFIMGREIMQRPEIFIVNQPTWGVDASAASFIRQRIRDLADDGAGVIVISQDLDEIFELADTIMVLNEGELSEPVPARDMNAQRLGQLMGGVVH